MHLQGISMKKSGASSLQSKATNVGDDRQHYAPGTGTCPPYQTGYIMYYLL